VYHLGESKSVVSCWCNLMQTGVDIMEINQLAVAASSVVAPYFWRT
jgi:hypothetical protein